MVLWLGVSVVLLIEGAEVVAVELGGFGHRFQMLLLVGSLKQIGLSDSGTEGGSIRIVMA